MKSIMIQPKNTRQAVWKEDNGFVHIFQRNASHLERSADAKPYSLMNQA